MPSRPCPCRWAVMPASGDFVPNWSLAATAVSHFPLHHDLRPTLISKPRGTSASAEIASLQLWAKASISPKCSFSRGSLWGVGRAPGELGDRPGWPVSRPASFCRLGLCCCFSFMCSLNKYLLGACSQGAGLPVKGLGHGHGSPSPW